MPRYEVTLKDGSKMEVEAPCLAKILEGKAITWREVSNVQELDVQQPKKEEQK